MIGNIPYGTLKITGSTSKDIAQPETRHYRRE